MWESIAIYSYSRIFLMKSDLYLGPLIREILCPKCIGT